MKTYIGKQLIEQGLSIASGVCFKIFPQFFESIEKMMFITIFIDCEKDDYRLF